MFVSAHSNLCLSHIDIADPPFPQSLTFTGGQLQKKSHLPDSLTELPVKMNVSKQ